MRLPEAEPDAMATRLSLIHSHLDERAWRLLLGAEAKALGRGGIPGRVRRPGAGRPSRARTDPGLVEALDGLVEPGSRGDPESQLRWTTKSTAKLAAELSAAGHRVSARTVARLLKASGYSLQANAKAVEGKQHRDRDAQFGYLNTQAARFQATADPVISVDTKKKELIGNYAAAGREWEPAGQPVRVNVHDFPDPALGKVAPYGVYDITTNTGWVNVGTDADTGQFAVESIRRWWHQLGAPTYPRATRVLITADSGGSNGARLRLWKTELASLAQETGLAITVCHLPPGTSKWNKIEHRLFSAISRNWRGRPLESHEVVIETLKAVTTSTGLTVHAEIDTNTYTRGIKIADRDMKALETTGVLTRHEFHGDWNYTLTPTTRPTEPT